MWGLKCKENTRITPVEKKLQWMLTGYCPLCKTVSLVYRFLQTSYSSLISFCTIQNDVNVKKNFLLVLICSSIYEAVKLFGYNSDEIHSSFINACRKKLKSYFFLKALCNILLGLLFIQLLCSANLFHYQ